jgi:thiamine kinase-like enzyme
MSPTTVTELIPEIISHFGLAGNDYTIDRIGSGYIHHTFKLTGKRSYILQRVNKNVFKEPEIIASNLRVASDYLKRQQPNYLFLTGIKTLEGKEMTYDIEGFPWRLFPYFENTFTVDKVVSEREAFSAAAEFARLTRYLDGVDTSLFKASIEKFHDLSLRFEQFECSLKQAAPDRLSEAEDVIQKSKDFAYLVKEYETLINSGRLKLRITHNDTKINNILFDGTTKQAVCAIDLDTLMPGYFIYDMGDMIRTFVSPVDEEERDLEKISLRPTIYEALVKGYLSQLNDVLSTEEKLAIPFSGMMMTYIMALRMLTDFLNGDIYYQIRYKDQNLIRAKNQFRLLELLKKMQ